MAEESFVYPPDDAEAAVQRKRRELLAERWIEATSTDLPLLAGRVAHRLVRSALSAREQKFIALDGPGYPKTPDGRAIQLEVTGYLIDQGEPRFPLRSYPSSEEKPDVYVFALETSRDRRDFPVHSPEGWQFWVLPPSVIAERGRRPITLAELLSLAGPHVSLDELAETVDRLVPPHPRDVEDSPSWMSWTDEEVAELERERKRDQDGWWLEASSDEIRVGAQDEADQLVSMALGAEVRRPERAPSYLVLGDGRRLEVRTAVYLLTRTPTFSLRPKKKSVPPLEDGTPRPAPDVLVIAFATARERRYFGLWGPGPWDAWLLQPLMSDYDFWVLPAAMLTAHPRRKVALGELVELAGPPVSFAELADTVDAVAPPRST